MIQIREQQIPIKIAIREESRKANCRGDKLRIPKAKGFLEYRRKLGFKFIANSFYRFDVRVT